MLSMTGYGRAFVEIEGRQMTVEVKSVNHRFLDLSFRMPRNLMFLEDAARKAIGARLSRGHVDVFVTYRNLRTDARTVQVDEALFAAYVAALSRLRGALGPDLRDDRTLMGIAHMPDVMTVTEAEEDQEAVRALLESALGQALDALCAYLREHALTDTVLPRVNLPAKTIVSFTEANPDIRLLGIYRGNGGRVYRTVDFRVINDLPVLLRRRNGKSAAVKIVVADEELQHSLVRKIGQFRKILAIDLREKVELFSLGIHRRLCALWKIGQSAHLAVEDAAGFVGKTHIRARYDGTLDNLFPELSGYIISGFSHIKIPPWKKYQ